MGALGGRGEELGTLRRYTCLAPGGGELRHPVVQCLTSCLTFFQDYADRGPKYHLSDVCLAAASSMIPFSGESLLHLTQAWPGVRVYAQSRCASKSLRLKPSGDDQKL